MNVNLRRKRIKISVIACMLILVLLMTGSSRIWAAAEAAGTEEPEYTLETCKDSIVCVEVICWDGEEKIYDKRDFSGFVVSSDAGGLYVVTVHDGLSYSSGQKKQIRKDKKLKKDVRMSEKIEVVFQGDLRVSAGIVGESEQRNLAVLKLGQEVQFANTLRFAAEDAKPSEQIFLMGFPGAADDSDFIYNRENVLVIPGVIQAEYVQEEIKFQTHDIQATPGMVGGPLFDPNGYIVGMAQSMKMDGYDGTSISAGDIKAFLTTFQIGYKEYEEKIEIVAEKKKPILNIVLAVVIGILAMNLLLRHIRFKNKWEQTTQRISNDTTRYAEPVKGNGKKAKPAKAQNGNPVPPQQQNNQNGSGISINARLEYPAEKRVTMIRKAVFMIGRTRDMDMILDGSKGISRQHARIQYDGRQFLLSDLESTNHTFLNGIEVVPGKSRPLKDGDEIMVAKEKLYFRING